MIRIKKIPGNIGPRLARPCGGPVAGGVAGVGGGLYCAATVKMCFDFLWKVREFAPTIA